jgi:hypothetical protein
LGTRRELKRKKKEIRRKRKTIRICVRKKKEKRIKTGGNKKIKMSELENDNKNF